MIGSYWNYGWMGWIDMGIGMLINLTIVGLIIYLVVRAISRNGVRGIYQNDSNNVIEILKERYLKVN